MSPSTLRRPAALAVATIALWLAAERSGLAQSVDATKRQERGWRFVIDDRPSLRFEDLFRVDLTGLLDFEWRTDDDSDAGFERRRIGVDGRLFDVVAFELERDLGDDDDPWRDALVEFRKYRALRIRGGRFKIPFGAERLTSIRTIEFASRSIVTETLTPDRDVGVQIAGRLFDDVVAYMAGVFRHDGSSPPARDEDVWSGEHTAAGRVIVAPLLKTRLRPLRRMELAVGYTHGDLTEGLHSPVLQTSSGFEAFAPMYVAGVRQRLGVDGNLVQGRLAVRGEYLRLWDERRGQGLIGDDLPDLVADGWYLSAAWMAVGDLRDGGRSPRTPLFRGGAGAIQIAARVEALGFHSDAPWDEAFRNPRAANVLGNDFDAWTLGVNWQPVRYLKLQFNVIREHLADPERRPDASRGWSTSRLFRVQFSV